MVYFRYPCKDCVERTVDCHGKCERYLAAREEHGRLRQEVQKIKAVDDSFVEYKARIIYETRKRFEGRKRWLMDKEKLLDLLVAHSKDTGEDMQKYIDELMSLDVVRCSECRNWTGDRCRRFSCPPWAYCYTRANDYCSGGERK